MPTLVLQPGSSGIDTYIIDSAGVRDYNYGAQDWLTVGRHSTYNAKGMIRLDLSSIPADKFIVSATLTLRCNFHISDRTVSAHRALTQWYEGNALGGGGPPFETTIDGSSWNNRNHIGSVPWSGGPGGAAGSDYVATATDTRLITTDGVFYNWNVTDDVRGFYRGDYPNYGWWLIAPNIVYSVQGFISSDYTPNTLLRPKLTIVYEDIPGIVTGSVAGIATVSPVSLEAYGKLSGVSAGVATVVGDLSDPGRISGTAQGSSTVVGELASELLSGTAEGVASVAGLLGALVDTPVPIQNSIYITTIQLTDDDYNSLTDPTITSGDFKISKDFGSFLNVSILPLTQPSNSGQVRIILSSSEMNADNVMIKWSDPDDEWIDGALILQPTLEQFNDFPSFGDIVDEILDISLDEPLSAFSWDSVTLKRLLSWVVFIASCKQIQTASTGTLRNEDDDVNVAFAEASRGLEQFIRGKFS